MELSLPPIRDSNLPQADYPHNERLAKILSHGLALCAFADHYGSVTLNPDRCEVVQMVDRTIEVISILGDYYHALYPPPPTPTARLPSHPWEVATNEQATQGETGSKMSSQASFPSKCHSCEVIDAPGWCSGPDGQRTLCGACGLHYAKLMRRRDKAILSPPADGSISPPVNIAYLHRWAQLTTDDDQLS